MDNDSFNPLKIRGSQILGLKKLVVGAIEASGIKLKGIETGDPFSLISWWNGTKLGATISGAYHKGEVLPKDPHDYGALTLTANPDQNGEEGIITLAAIGPQSNKARVEVECKEKSGAGYKNIVIFDGAGQSSFLQFQGVTKRRIFQIQKDFSIAAGGQESGDVVVTHNLGSTIGFEAGQVGASGFAIPINCKMTATTPNTATFRAIASSAMPGAVAITFSFFITIYG